MALRLQAMGQPNYARGFRVALHPQALRLPMTWKRPRIVFVNSMSDLFHEKVSRSFVQEVFGVMHTADWHRYQVLTKRSGRLVRLDPHLEWADYIWMGVSVENAEYTGRIDDLRRIRASVKFLSLEPLLGPLVELNLSGIDWVIVGGESGPGARPMDEQWVLDIRDQCVDADVPFFFKQWGGVHRKKTGRLLEGRTWDQMPAAAPV